MLKKYTVFFSTDVRRLLEADSPETCYGQDARRVYCAANQFPSSFVEIMLLKPELKEQEEADQSWQARHGCFLGIWQGLYRHWDRVSAAYAQASRGTAYVSMIDQFGITKVTLIFGELKITLLMCYSSRPLGWLTHIGEEIIDDRRPVFVKDEIIRQFESD